MVMIAIRHLYKPLLSAATLCLTVFRLADACLTFESPMPDSPISAGVCTVSVAACEGAHTVELTAIYRVPGKNSPERRTLGTITRPPFKLMWNTSGLPNQLYEGMSLLAETTLRNRQGYSTSLNGIFLTHAAVERPGITIPFGMPRALPRMPAILQLSEASLSGNAEVRAAWNNENLLVLIKVADPHFCSSLPAHAFDRLGAEIMIDPTHGAKPYPSSAVKVFSVPLRNNPHQLIFTPSRTEVGGFSIGRSTQEIAYPTKIKFEDFKGYTLEIAIPWSAIGEKLPQRVGLNVAAHVLDPKGTVHRLSWAQGEGDNVYVPFLWGTADFQPKPLPANRRILWLLSLGGGFIVGFGGMLLSRLLRGMSPLGRFERTEREERLFRMIMNAIEDGIANSRLTQASVAQSLSVSPRLVNRILKRNHGEGFNECLMRSRVEIVKERLRSSHSSEASIAESCGFSSVDQMEKYFKRFCRTTPYRFREEHQVT